MGTTGNLGPDDIINILVAHPATAANLATELFEFFAYPNPSQDTVNRLAQVYLTSGYNIKSLVQAILTSPEFVSTQAYLANVKSPAEFAATSLRSTSSSTSSTSSTSASSTTTTQSSTSSSSRLNGAEIVLPYDVGDNESLNFQPASITVVIGLNNSVNWVDLDAIQHTVVSTSIPSGAQKFDSGILNQGQTFTWTFTVPGTYHYVCSIHPDWMGEPFS